MKCFHSSLNKICIKKHTLQQVDLILPYFSLQVLPFSANVYFLLLYKQFQVYHICPVHEPEELGDA
jgi:hypothetical protein